MERIIKDVKTGLNMREGTLDEYVIREQSSYTKLFERCKGKTVVDIGGNIGAFAFNCELFGAKEVHSFEPEPENIKLFKSQKLKLTKLHEFAVAEEDGVAFFYVNGGKNKGLHSLDKTRGREHIEVKTIAFEKVLKKLNPDVLKIDIEGGEYGLDFDLILKSNVKVIAVEIHLVTKSHYTQGIELIDWLNKHFEPMNTPIDTSHPITSWTKTFVGKRK